MIPRLVTVIIPTYNRPHYLPEAVKSVLAQTYPSIELIIIDDGSDDEGALAKAALKPYLSPNRSTDSPKVTYIYQENQGPPATVNRGLSLANGEYIQRLDDDDRLLPEKIARSVEVFEAHPEVGLVATGYYDTDAEGRHLHTGLPGSYPRSWRALRMMMRCISRQPAVMVRSSVHQKVGLYQDTIGEDYEMWIRIAKAYDIETIDEPLAEYRLHSGNVSRVKRLESARNITDFILKHVESTPLDVLIPDLKSEPHAYALRAAVCLRWSADRRRLTKRAKQELDRAHQLLPNDPLILLWKGLLAMYQGEPLPPLSSWVKSMSAAYRPRAEALIRFERQRKELEVQKIDPSSQDAIDYRRRLGEWRSALLNDTCKAARGETE